MKIKNDLISIKIGKKHYDFNNMILDTYLKTFVSSQISIENTNQTNNGKNLTCLLIKFDTPFENLNEKSMLVNEDFDVYAFGRVTSTQEVLENKIIVQYQYETDKVLSYSSSNFSEQKDISEYYGKKITALGFNNFGSKSTSIYTDVKAVLDMSNYNIYLQEKQDFVVTRRDIVTTDALFYSNNKSKVPGPLHLMPVFNKAVIEPNIIYDNTGNYSITGADKSYGVIYSVGLSSFTDRIDKEFIIGEDVEVTQNGTELEIQSIENYLNNENLLYPNSNLYPSSNLYPIKSNYKYIILKYKVWQNILSGTYENPAYTMTDTGYFYYQAIPIDKFGKLNFKIKYERG